MEEIHVQWFLFVFFTGKSRFIQGNLFTSKFSIIPDTFVPHYKYISEPLHLSFKRNDPDAIWENAILLLPMKYARILNFNALL